MADYGATLKATSCNFTECSSGGYGGAIYWYPPTSGQSSYSYSNGKVELKYCIFCSNTASNGPDLCIRSNSKPDENPFIDCTTYNSDEQYTSGYYDSGYSSYYEQSSWISRSGETCPSDSGGGGESGEVVYDIDDVIIDECSSDDGDPTPGKTLYVSTDGAETSNCGMNRE